jgi:hypothetical protein
MKFKLHFADQENVAESSSSPLTPTIHRKFLTLFGSVDNVGSSTLFSLKQWFLELMGYMQFVIGPSDVSEV